jgi:hypothetical protein
MDISKTIHKILEEPFWPEEIDSNEPYTRVHDDCDGDMSQTLSVTFSIDGDAWVTTEFSASRRFRTYQGGGMSLRVRNALLILAMAIKKDNEEKPQ